MGLAYKEFVTAGPAAASGLEYSLEIVYADLEVEAIVESNECASSFFVLRTC